MQRVNEVSVDSNFVEVERSAVPSLSEREFSSAGLEHLPYKQRVGGSNPSTPTKSRRLFKSSFFCARCRIRSVGGGVAESSASCEIAIVATQRR